jgi:hypothetical protein
LPGTGRSPATRPDASSSSSTVARRARFPTTGSASASTTLAGNAGARHRARTPAGEREGTFPDLIGQQAIVDGAYQALFPAYDRLEVELGGGGTLVFEFEGDLWETEDHRNWTDANFKTYSTPISRGRAYRRLG